MRVIIYGASGMVGQSVLREALLSAEITEIVCVGRSPLPQTDSKIKMIVLPDMTDQTPVKDYCKDFDACYYCLGTTAMGKTEEAYTRITFDLTMNVANTLKEHNPKLTFVYVCAKGSDTSEQGPIMWARVRGRLENALFKLGLYRVYSLRPSYIQPMDGIKSKTSAYRILYNIVSFAYPLLKIIAPKEVTSTREMGIAMIKLAKDESAPQILNPIDINLMARR